MFKKLDFILEKYEELSMTVSDPEVIANQSLWQKKIKEMGEMEPVVTKYKEYKKVQDDLAATEEMLNEPGMDDEMREMAKEELTELKEQSEKLTEELKVALLPKDPNDDKNVILEVRAGTGGEEAALFGADLLRMYTRYAERRGWKVEIMDMNDTGIGVELVAVRTSTHNNDKLYEVEPLLLKHVEGSHLFFENIYQLDYAGGMKFGLRMYPQNELLPHRMDFCYVRWI